MLTDGLLGYWPFDGTTADASGNGNDLALFGDATFASGGLFGGLALSVHYTGLGGADGGAEALSNNPAFDFSNGNFTIQLWAKFNNINDGRQEALIEKLTGAPAPGWGVTMPSKDLEFDSSNVPRSSGPLQIPNRIWQEFVITGDGNTVSFYWNGTFVGSAPLSPQIPPSSNPLLIGARNAQDGRDFTFDGLIDNVAIWDRPLTSTEVAQSWNNGAGLQLSVPSIPPPVVVSIDNTDVNVAHGIGTVTFSFSDAPVAFTLADISAVGGTVSNLSQINPTTYTATFTASPDTDIANASVSLTTTSSVKFSSAVATFYEVQNNWAPSQMIDGLFTVPGPGDFGGVNGWSVYNYATGESEGADALLTLATALPPGEYTLTFTIYQNYFGNPGHILGDFALDYTTAASPTLSSPQTPVSIKSVSSLNGTTFSVLSPGELLANTSHNSVGTDTYTIAASVDSASPITGIFLDAIKNPLLPGGGPGGQYGNGNFVVSEFTLNARAIGSTGPFTVDTVVPTVGVSIDNTLINQVHTTGTVTFAFSEAPVPFTLADTSAVGGTLSNLQLSDATHYTATFTGAPSTDISNASVSVTAGSWHEGNGNAGAGGSTAAFTVDMVAPTVGVSIDNTFINQVHTTGTVTFAFSEAPTAFTLADTGAVGGTLSNLQQTDGTHYIATFTGGAQTRITNASVSVTAGSWQENNGNPGSSGSTALFEVDTLTTPVPPTIIVNSYPAATHGQVIALSTLVAISDGFGLGFQELELWDSQGTPFGGQFVVKGVAQTGGHQIDLSPADVTNALFDVGTLGGIDTLWARLLRNDGTLTPWQQFAVAAPIDTPPAVIVSNRIATHGHSFSASSLFMASDPDGDAITEYDFWDTGAGGGHFVLNSQVLGPNQDNYISASQLAQTTYQSGSGAETLWVRVSDGAQWSPWSQAFTVTAPIDTGPVVAPLQTNISVSHGQSLAASSLFIASDPFGDPITQYDFWNMGAGGGHFVLGNQVLGASQENLVSASQLLQTTYQSGSGTDTLWVRISDGSQWSPWSQSFTVTAPIDTGPVVGPTKINVSAAHNQSFAVSSLFIASDPFSDPITQYDFWNMGAGGGRFTFNGQTLGANQDNYISGSQLSQTEYQSGSGTDTLWVRVSDGSEWSPWSRSFTVTAPIDAGPTVVPTNTNVSAAHNQSFAVSSLFIASDPFNDPITQYDFWNMGAGGGHFVLGNQVLGASQENLVSASQLLQTTYQSGSGTDRLWVRVSDGSQWSPWSQAFTVTAPIDTGPVVAPLQINTSVLHGQSLAASSLFTASDPFNDPITQYDFWNAGAGGGHFIVSGQPRGANQGNYVSASELPQTAYQSSSGTDTLWVRVSDGSQWSAWSQGFTVTAPIDTGPVVTSVSNIHTTSGQIFAASNLFTASDPFNDPIEQYDFWDTGAGGGHFTLNGQPLGTNQQDVVSAAQLTQASYVAGSGTDMLWVRVSEGGQWSVWSPSFTVSDPTSIGAGETLELTSGYSGQLSFAADTGTLKLDDPASFVGTVAGMAGQDTMDLASIDPTKVQAPNYSGTASSGTLTLTDGSRTANIALLGNYLASIFVASSDGHGGTNVVEHTPADHISVLAQPAH